MLLRYGFLLILWKSKMCSIEVPETGELPHSPLASQCRISLPWYLVHVLDRWWCVYLWFLSILSYTESLFRLKNIYKSILYLNPVHYLLLCLSRLLVVCYKFQCFNILCKAVFVKKKKNMLNDNMYFAQVYKMFLRMNVCKYRKISPSS